MSEPLASIHTVGSYGASPSFRELLRLFLSLSVLGLRPELDDKLPGGEPSANRSYMSF